MRNPGLPVAAPSRGPRLPNGYARGLAILVDLFIAVACVADPVAAAVVTAASDICSAASDPCIVDRAIDVAPGSVLTFGSRALQLNSNGQLRVGSGQMTIRCGSLNLAQGSKLSGLGTASVAGGRVVLEIENSATILGSIDVSGASAGTISITAGGAFTSTGGRLLASALGAESEGGVIEISADTVSFTGTMNASGGSLAAGGRVEIEAATSMMVGGSIVALGGEGDAGDIDLACGGRILFTSSASVLADGRGGGFGGAISVQAGDPLAGDAADGSLDLAGTISAVANSSADGAGDGGQISLGARDGCRLVAKIAATGGTPDGNGGEVSVDCGSTEADGVIVSGDISVRGLGSDSGGGSVLVNVPGALQLQSKLDAGGFVGGPIELTSGADLVASSSAILSSNGSGAGSTGGSLRLRACRTTVAAASKLSATGRAGSILLSGATRLEIAGAVTADDASGAVELVYRDAVPILQSTARIQPAPMVHVGSNLPPCNGPTIVPKTVTPTAKPTLTSTPTPTMQPLATTSRTARAQPTSTPTRTPRSTPSAVRPTPAGQGDANCDGVIDSLDLDGPTQAIFDPDFFAACSNADTNGNGRADAGDYPGLFLLREVAP